MLVENVSDTTKSHTVKIKTPEIETSSNSFNNQFKQLVEDYKDPEFSDFVFDLLNRDDSDSTVVNQNLQTSVNTRGPLLISSSNFNSFTLNTRDSTGFSRSDLSERDTEADFSSSMLATPTSTTQGTTGTSGTSGTTGGTSSQTGTTGTTSTSSSSSSQTTQSSSRPSRSSDTTQPPSTSSFSSAFSSVGTTTPSTSSETTSETTSSSAEPTTSSETTSSEPVSSTRPSSSSPPSTTSSSSSVQETSEDSTSETTSDPESTVESSTSNPRSSSETFASSTDDATSSEATSDDASTTDDSTSERSTSKTSTKASITDAPSSSFTPYSTTLSSGGTTITTLITVPTSAEEAPSDSGTTASRNSKLIGGLVGSIGGTILIGSLVVLFLFLRKRKRNSYKNQNPDFNDGSDEESLKKGGGFKKLFGSKGFGDGDVKSFDRIPSNDETDDFQYRGVTNNNLDSIFRSSGTNSGGNTAHYGSTAPGSTGNNSTGQNSNRHSRFNSVGYPGNTLQEEDEPFNFNNHNRQSSDELEPDDYLDHNHLLQQNPIFGDGNASNNSRSRFTEEII